MLYERVAEKISRLEITSFLKIINILLRISNYKAYAQHSPSTAKIQF
jgi:hypothetical protein